MVVTQPFWYNFRSTSLGSAPRAFPAARMDSALAPAFSTPPPEHRIVLAGAVSPPTAPARYNDKANEPLCAIAKRIPAAKKGGTTAENQA